MTPHHTHGTVLRQLSIFLSVLLLVLITHTIFNIPGLSWAMPWLGACAVFYWSLFTPERFWMGEAFLLGLMEDIIVGTPPGLHAFGFVVVYEMAWRQRQYLTHKPFSVIWFGFAIILGMGMGFMAILNWLMEYQVSTFIFLTWLITVLAFPFVYASLHALHNRLRHWSKS